MTRFGMVLVMGALMAPPYAIAGDEIFERDLSTPFLRDDDDRFLRDRDLPGPLRQTWPFTDRPEFRFKAVEARRACHARTLFEVRQLHDVDATAIARLESERDGRLRYVVRGQYEAEIDGARQAFVVTCKVSSREVMAFKITE